MRLPEYSTATSVFVVTAMESTEKLLKVFVIRHAGTMKTLNVAVHGLIAFSKKMHVSENTFNMVMGTFLLLQAFLHRETPSLLCV